MASATLVLFCRFILVLLLRTLEYLYPLVILHTQFRNVLIAVDYALCSLTNVNQFKRQCCTANISNTETSETERSNPFLRRTIHKSNAVLECYR